MWNDISLWFNLHFPDDHQCWASFHIPVGYLHVLSRKMSSPVFCPFFLNQGAFVCLFVFDVNCIHCFYVMDIKLLLFIAFANIFSHSVGWLFFILNGFLWYIESVQVQLGPICLFFILFCFRRQIKKRKKVLLWFMSKSVQPMFSSKSFIVSGLTFMLLIYFEYIFEYSVREFSNFILLHAAVSFPNTIYWRDSLISIVYFYLLCYRLIAHSALVYFWALYSVLLICFCESTILFWWLYLWNVVWSH